MRRTAVHDKGSHPLNEDVLLVGSKIFGVFDGATGLVPYVDEAGQTGGYIAADIARMTFDEGEDGKDLLVLARLADGRIATAMRKAGVDFLDPLNRWFTTVSVVRILRRMFEWVQIGDSSIIVIYRDGSFRKLPNQACDPGIMELWQELAAEGVRDIAKSPKMDAMVKAVRRKANETYGFLGGDPKAMDFLRYGRVSLEDVACILIYSDGFEVPQKDPRADGTKELVQLFMDGGLGCTKSFIRAVEDNDPECLERPRYRKHDDLTAIALTF